MSKDTPHDREAAGGERAYYCSGCDPEGDEKYPSPGKCSNCGNLLTNEPPVYTLKKNEPPVYT